MNGIIKWCMTRCAAAASMVFAVTLSGCATLCPTCGHDGSWGHGGLGHGGLGHHGLHGAKEFDWDQVHPDRCWPDQYSRESRRRVRAPFRRQLIEGNKLECTMWDYFFDKSKGFEHTLNEGGKAHLRYLARKRPYVIPSLQLQTSYDQELDQKRVGSIIDFANKVSLEPLDWQVAVINQVPTGLFGAEGTNVINDMLSGTNSGTVKTNTAVSSGESQGIVTRGNVTN